MTDDPEDQPRDTTSAGLRSNETENLTQESGGPWQATGAGSAAKRQGRTIQQRAASTPFQRRV